jgi:hypothetical protein
VFSLAIYGLAMWLRLPDERVHEYVGDLTAEAEEEEKIIGDAIPAKGH